MTLTKAGEYDPKADRKLFGDGTDDFVKAISKSSENPADIEWIVEKAARDAKADSSTEFATAGHADRVKHLARVLRWVEDTRNITLGPIEAAANRIMKIVAGPPAQPKTREDLREPELVNAGHVTEEELSYFEKAPALLTPDQYQAERAWRTPTKGSLPETYPESLGYDDIGKDGDVNDVLNAIIFFLGVRGVGEGKPTHRGRVKEPPMKRYLAELEEDAGSSAGEATADNEAKVKGLIFKVLGHMRDEKYKAWKEALEKYRAWKEAREKREAGERPSKDDERHARFYGKSYETDSNEAKILGRTVADLRRKVDDLFSKNAKEPGQKVGDHLIVADHAGILNRVISGLLGYVEAMGKGRTVTDKDGKQVPFPTPLQEDLSRLKDFVEKGEHREGEETYKAMVAQMKEAMKGADLTDDQRQALHLMFPRAAGEYASLKELDDWIGDMRAQSSDWAGHVRELERSLAATEENPEDLSKMMAVVDIKGNKAYESFREANALSEPLTRAALRAMTAPFFVRRHEMGDDEVKAALDGATNSLMAKYSSKYGEKNTQRVLDLVREHILAQREAKAARKRLESTRGGKAFMDLDTAKKNKAVRDRLLKAAESLVTEEKAAGPSDSNAVQFKSDALRDFREKANALMKWVYESRDRNIKSYKFPEINKLAKQFDEIRKALIALSRVEKANVLWDYGVGIMYRDRGETPPAAYGEADAGPSSATLPDDPEQWIVHLRNNGVLKFLLKKSEELAKRGAGRPEQVAGPSFSQIPSLVGYIEGMTKELKKYDPDAVLERHLETAFKRADIGGALSSAETRKSKRREERERQKGYESRGVEPIEPVKPEKVPEPQKQASLADDLRIFMAKMAAIRAAARLGILKLAGKMELPSVYTRRQKKTGPVYLNAFFLNPDGVDEFMLALQRNGFNFVKSLAMAAEEPLGMTPEQMKKEMPSPEAVPGQKQPARGYKFDIDKTVTETMMKGSDNIQQHILKNKDRISMELGRRMDEAKREAEKAEKNKAIYTEKLQSPELKKQLAFIKALAAFIRNPRQAVSEALPAAFTRRIHPERRRALRNIQKEVAKQIYKVKHRDEFERRRNELRERCERAGIDPETRSDYRYADEVVKDVDFLTKYIKPQDLQKLHDDIPRFDRLKHLLDKMEESVALAPGVNVGEIIKYRTMEKRVNLIERFLSRKESFRRIQELYPAGAVDEPETETAELYEKIKGKPEDWKARAHHLYDQRRDELSEIGSWEDFSSWIRKLQSHKPTETSESVSVQLKQTKGLKAILDKRIADAEAKIKAIDDKTGRPHLAEELASLKSQAADAAKKAKEAEPKVKATGRKSKKPAVTEELAALRSQAADAARKAEEAESKMKATDDETGRKRLADELATMKSQAADAAKSIDKDEKKLLQMTKRKTELGGIEPAVYDPAKKGRVPFDPKETRRLWKELLAKVEAVLLGKAKEHTKTLVDLANENMLAYVDPDEFTAGVRKLWHGLSEAGAQRFIVLKGLFGSLGDWGKTKAGIEARLTSLKSDAEGKRALLAEARKKMEEMPSDTEDVGEDVDLMKKMPEDEREKAIERQTQRPRQKAEADIAGIEHDISNLSENEATLRSLMNEIDTLYTKQMDLSRERVNGILARSVPKPEVSTKNFEKTIDALADERASKEDVAAQKEVDGRLIDFASEVTRGNKQVQQEMDYLSWVKSEIDTLYLKGAERDAVLKKIEQKEKEMSSITRDPTTRYVAEVVKAMKAKGSKFGPGEENKFTDNLSERLKWFTANRRRVEPETEEKGPRYDVRTFISTFPSNLRDDKAIKTRSVNAMHDFKRKADEVSDPLALKALVNDYMSGFEFSRKHKEELLKMFRESMKFVRINDPWEHEELSKHVQKVLAAFDTYLEFHEEARKVVDETIKKLEAIWTPKPEGVVSWPPESKKIEAELKDIKKEIDNAWASWNNDMENYKRETLHVYPKRETPRPEPEIVMKPLKTEPELPTGVLKKASEDEDPGDTQNIENWLRSAPRDLLESMSKIDVDDWSIIESLYGEKKAEYNDLIRQRQAVVDGPDAEKRAEQLKKDAQARAKELSRLEALADLRVTIGDQKVRLSDAGDIFSKELSQYLKSKSTLTKMLDKYTRQHDSLSHELESYGEFVGKKEDATEEEKRTERDYELKKELDPREMQSITDQFYRGLYWYLQDYWRTKPGREAIFGSQDSPEFWKLYDTLKTLAGVRSNPVIQKVIQAGSVGKHMKEVNDAINKIAAGFKRVGRDPEKVLERIEEQYDLSDKVFTSEKEVGEEAKRVARQAALQPATITGVQLYFLVKYREQLKANIASKKAMYELLQDVVPAEYKKSVLDAIKTNVAGEHLKKEIADGMEAIEADAGSSVDDKIKKAGDEVGKVVTEGMKTVDEVKILKDAIEDAKTAPEESKQASYMDRPGFDLGIFYGKVMQDKIASMAARYLKMRLKEV